MINSMDDIYNVIERALRSLNEPATCVRLMEMNDVRQAALAEFGDDVQLATNKLSDTLGFMWRRGVLDRFPAPRGNGTKARFAYMFKKEKVASLSPLPSPASKKPTFTITETDSDVTIEFDHVTLIVRRR
jgi:hypothetical protein